MRFRLLIEVYNKSGASLTLAGGGAAIKQIQIHILKMMISMIFGLHLGTGLGSYQFLSELE